MKLPQLNKMKWNYKALAFFLPFISIVLIMIVGGYTPFGDYSMLYSDMYHQYYPFFKAFRKALLSGDSLLYSWNVGMGMDYLGLISYYLASPLNLLGVLVPESMTLVYFSFLVPIKLGLAGLFFAIFLSRTFEKNDFSITLFGVCYALCAWALGYQWNVMWLDTFALLPLVALGTISLLKDRKFLLYTLTLFLSIFSNYYIGFFTCIFILLTFICYQICRCRSIKRFFADLFLIALFSILAIGMTAILELPALAALQTTQSSVNKFPTTFSLNITDDDTWKGLLDAMRQVAGNMCGGIEPSFKEGLPNLYCGLGSIMLAFLFLTSRDVKLRDKICCVFLLLFFIVSFIIRQLDYIWHGFHFTNMIPYRFSFLYSFVILYMAYRAWLLRDSFRLWQVIGAGLSICVWVICSDHRSEPLFLVYNLGPLVLYMIAGVYGTYRKKQPALPVPPADAEYTSDLSDFEAQLQDYDARIEELEKDRRLRRSTSCSLLAGVLVVEMIMNVINFGVAFPCTSVSNYPKGTDETASVIRYMKEREDSLFYRTEVTRTQTLNDGALNDYNGISTFTSSANVQVTEFMKDLGYAAKNTYNRYCYELGSPVSELFLNLKYLIDRDDNPVDNPYYTDVYTYGDVHLLESDIYLPLGFLAESQLGELNFETSDHGFAFQNELFRTATGVSSGVWHVLNDAQLVVDATDVTISGNITNGRTVYEAGDQQGYLTYSFTADQDGYMCITLDLSAKNKFTVSINGTEIYNDNMSLPYMAAVGNVSAGDAVQIRLTCKANEDSSMTIKAAILDDDLFRQGYEVLAASTMELTAFENTFVEGTLTCNRDGLLYTSIPQDGNWTATVDGQPAEITLVGDAMIGLYLSEGSHTVSFTYRNEAFELGWKISLGCLLSLGCLALIFYRKQFKRTKGRFEH